MERNRISNVSFAVCSAGEIIILAVMVGILKGLKSDASTENNTKAFSALIAFSGGVWRMYRPSCFLCLIANIAFHSPLRPSLVLPGETSPWSCATFRRLHVNHRLQADIHRFPRVHETQANVLIFDLLLLDVCCFLSALRES